MPTPILVVREEQRTRVIARIKEELKHADEFQTIVLNEALCMMSQPGFDMRSVRGLKNKIVQIIANDFEEAGDFLDDLIDDELDDKHYSHIST